MSNLMYCHVCKILNLLPKSILPPNRVVGVVPWQIESVVKQANGGPSGCPPNRLFVPVSVRSQVIHWAHTSLLTCPPGVKRTTFMIQQLFWWPAMRKQVAEYVAACTFCARNMTSTGAQMGLLHHISFQFCLALILLHEHNEQASDQMTLQSKFGNLLWNSSSQDRGGRTRVENIVRINTLCNIMCG